MMRLATREHSIEDRSLQTEASSSTTRLSAALPHEVSTCSAASMHERGTAMDGKMDQSRESTGGPADGDGLPSEEQQGQMATKVKASVERVKGKLAQAVDQMKAALRSKRSHRFANDATGPPRACLYGLSGCNPAHHAMGGILNRGIALNPDRPFSSDCRGLSPPL
jgi:hypothetical protein